MYLSSLFGRLSQGGVFPSNPLTAGAALGILAIIILTLIVITVTHRWKWLYREWLTTTNHKKIGVMYLLVAVLMLIRGVLMLLC